MRLHTIESSSRPFTVIFWREFSGAYEAAHVRASSPSAAEAAVKDAFGDHFTHLAAIIPGHVPVL